MPAAPDRQADGSSRFPQVEEFQKAADFTPTLGHRPIASGETAAAAPPPTYDDDFLRNLKQAREQHAGRQVKVKKRRRKGGDAQRDTLTDWDTFTDQLPEAEILSDTWLEPMPIPEEVITEKESEIILSEHEEDGQTVRRIKRVRKRRIFTLAQLFFRRLSYGMRVFTVSMVSAITIAGVWYGIVVFRKRFVPVTFDDVVAEARPDRRFLGKQDESGAAEAVTAYLAAEGVEQKLAHVRLPNRVRPMMEAWYQRYPDKAATAGEVVNRDKMVAGGAYFVRLEMKVVSDDPLAAPAPGTGTKFFIVEEFEKDGNRTYKVDWETAVEWRQMSFEDFKLEQPRTAVPFRIKIRESDYYNHEFTDETRWLAAELSYPLPDRSGFVFYGYIDRRSKAWNQLRMFTEGNTNPSVIVNLRYPDNAVSRDQVIIDSLVHPSWYYTEDVPPAEMKDTLAPLTPPVPPQDKEKGANP